MSGYATTPILFGYAEAAKCLIERGADLKAKDKHGQTPVHLAVAPQVKRFNQEIIRALIDHHAPLDELNKEGLTPLHLTIRENEPEAPLHLIEGRANVNTKNHCGTTALHLAIFHGHPQTAIALLDHGAVFNIKSSEMGEEGVSLTAEELCQQRGEAMAEVLQKIKTIRHPDIKG